MTPDKRQDIQDITLVDINHQKRLIAVSFEIRIFSILVGLICAHIIGNVVGVRVPGEVLLIFYLWLVTSAIYLTVFKTNICKTMRVLNNVHFSYYFLGITYATGLVHYLGGAEWIAFFVYLFDLVYANVLIQRARSALVSILIALCYFILVFLEYKGIIPHQRIFPLEDASYNNLTYLVSTNIIVVGGVFFLMAYATGLFSKMKENREKSLRESRNRFETKSFQLENITKTLRRKAAENIYLKRATMGYIEKKEYELETARKDLEAQIEKLRKTQKSMYFMIEDLNEMSAQLKDTRDHLEDKVRSRTDELLNISRKLHRSERLAFLGKLAGSVTHELRNPLAVLKNSAYFLDKKFSEKKGKKDEKVMKYIDVMKKEISIIDSIIDDIMGFAKTKAPDLEEADIRDVIENALSMINVPDLIKVEKEFEDLPGILIDSNQIMHAVVNIANNAIVAMKGNGTLVFRALKKGDQVCVEIEDNGPGIPPDQRELIFEPLYSSKPKGTGLGLPIAKMMVENQDGRIEFTSELGGGTVFSILLPIERKGRGR